MKDVKGLQILVCGGDGTVGWVMDVMDKMGLAERNIPVRVSFHHSSYFAL